VTGLTLWPIWVMLGLFALNVPVAFAMGIARRLMNLADALVGHMVGGLAQANIVLATLMGGLSASANAEAAMQAKLLGPETIRRGYAPGFTAAVIACAAVITPITPPGIDPVHFGLIMVINLTIGGVTPPVGTMMYTACGILEVKLSRFTIEGAPLILAMIGVLALVTLHPPLVTALPNALMGRG